MLCAHPPLLQHTVHSLRLGCTVKHSTGGMAEWQDLPGSSRQREPYSGCHLMPRGRAGGSPTLRFLLYGLSGRATSINGSVLVRVGSVGSYMPDRLALVSLLSKIPLNGPLTSGTRAGLPCASSCSVSQCLRRGWNGRCMKELKLALGLGLGHGRTLGLWLCLRLPQASGRVHQQRRRSVAEVADFMACTINVQGFPWPPLAAVCLHTCMLPLLLNIAPIAHRVGTCFGSWPRMNMNVANAFVQKQ